ncbi:cell division topological specificity factor MinE [uncultured Jannaschia sp.]|uniref:cell division topological specificity factor MinE n=1 Tax=uncultured Jannaschia sp. TaxID=293347 RepID=UPI00260E9F27|nr:cell division topological specificity factor MinE [uncultured Jannaschia sp.]
MFGFFRQQPRRSDSARAAKERLQILLAHDRSDRARDDLLPLLQRDILAVVKRHMRVDGDAVEIKLERGDDMSSLEINIEVPDAQPGQAG